MFIDETSTKKEIEDYIREKGITCSISLDFWDKTNLYTKRVFIKDLMDVQRANFLEETKDFIE